MLQDFWRPTVYGWWFGGHAIRVQHPRRRDEITRPRDQLRLYQEVREETNIALVGADAVAERGAYEADAVGCPES